jgi:hypothetical protein
VVYKLDDYPRAVLAPPLIGVVECVACLAAAECRRKQAGGSVARDDPREIAIEQPANSDGYAQEDDRDVGARSLRDERAARTTLTSATMKPGIRSAIAARIETAVLSIFPFPRSR